MNQALSRSRMPITTAAALAAIGIVSLIMTFARSDAGAATSSGSVAPPETTDVAPSVAVLGTTASSVALSSPTTVLGETNSDTAPTAVPCPGAVQGQTPAASTPAPTNCVTITLRLPIGLEPSTRQICNFLDKYHLADILMSIGDVSDPALTCT
jgi:hypothetical protein